MTWPCSWTPPAAQSGDQLRLDQAWKRAPIKSNTGRRRLNISGAIDVQRMSAGLERQIEPDEEEN
jgi:hypothetical protein